MDNTTLRRFEFDVLVPDGLEEFAQIAAPYYAEALRVLIHKQHDYGPRNIGASGSVGLVVRITDKVSRYKNLVFNTKEPNYETRADTAVDITNYGIIERLVEDGTWPVPAPKTLAEYLETKPWQGEVLPTIYVSGPYTAKTPEMRDYYVDVARECAQLLAKNGYAPFCPHTQSHNWENDTDLAHEDFLRIDFEWIKRCDGIVMLPFWEQSNGATAEHALAEELNIPIYQYFPAEVGIFTTCNNRWRLV